MEDACKICGKKLGFFSSSFDLYGTQGGPDKICEKCADALMAAKHRGSTGDALDSIDYLNHYINAGVLEPKVLDYVVAVIQQDESVYQTPTSHDAQQRARIRSLMTTSGPSFDGYQIDAYLQFITAETAVGMGAFKSIAASFSNMLGEESRSLKKKLNEAKAIVFDDFYHQVVGTGANAVICIDLEYTMFADSIVGVIVSGTAVQISKRPGGA